MTKSELISEVQNKTWFVMDFGGLVLDQEWPAVNVKLYRASVVAEIAVNTVSTAHLYFYVIDEGGAGEVAYYKDATPEEQVGIVV